MPVAFAISLLPLLVAATPPERFELVVRWPDAPQSNYSHVYASAAACARGKAVIAEEHAHQVAAVQKANQPPPGQRYPSTIRMPPRAPIAICVPL